MDYLDRLILCAVLLWTLPLIAQDAHQSAADDFRNQAQVVERQETSYHMQADGTGERDLHVVLRIQSSGAAQQFSVLAIAYASANETPEIKYVRVLKADGATVETPASDAIDMPAEVTREAPLYSDLKEKHIPVRSLAAGDRLEYAVATHITRSEASGQFWGATHFTAPGSVIVLAETLSLDVPADKYLQVWSPNHKATVTSANGRKIYTWTAAQLTPPPVARNDDQEKPESPKDPDEDADGHKLPSVAWTTFHSWAEVGDWYRDLSLGQAKVSDMVKARAAEIVAGTKSPEDEVRALYEFVSTHTRYVGIDFGVGRYKPHTADEVLANQYGDCKDKDTLLEALLKARGFEAAPALIGIGVAPVAELPSPAVFDHVITTVTLPSGRIWMDSTPEAAPFRYLLALIRDQKALVVPPVSAAALVGTPVLAPYPFTEHFEADGVLDSEGRMKAKMRASYHDDSEVLVRALARTAAPADRDKVSQYISAATGFSGTTSNTAFEHADDATAPIVVTYDYIKHPFGDWDSLRILPLFPVLEFPSLDSKTLAPEQDIELGAPRTLTATTHVHLPDGYHTDLPDPVHVHTPFASFDLTYGFDGKQITVERSVQVLQKKIAKTEWKQYQDFTHQIGMETMGWIQLIAPQKKIQITVEKPLKTEMIAKNADGSTTVTLRAESKPPAKSSAAAAPPQNGDATAMTVAELMQEFLDRTRAYDWSGARAALDKVKAKNAQAENLWAGYGIVAQYSDHDSVAARTDLQKELEYHPDNLRALRMLVELQTRTGDSAGARRSLQSFLDGHADNLNLWYMLVRLQTKAGDDEGALHSLEAAMRQFPDEPRLRSNMAEALVRLKRMDEAAAAAKSALDGVEDPETLNNAAFALSETGRDLSVAEEAARKAIAKLEQDSATLTTEQANSHTFALATLTVSAWDTLGWILYEQGQYDEARKWIEPAWRASLREVVGSHLGLVLEKLGKREEAAATFRLAQTAENMQTTPDVKQQIDDGLARTAAAAESGKGGPKSLRVISSNQEALQQLRTYKIKRPAGAKGWGTFRLRISAAGVVESQQMSGDDKLATIKPTLMAMKFPELLPPGSKAQLLRSAVISCSMGDTCEIVFVPDGGLQTEQQ